MMFGPMPTFLLTWNPARWPWVNLTDASQQTVDGTPTRAESTGNTNEDRTRGSGLPPLAKRGAEGHHRSRVGHFGRSLRGSALRPPASRPRVRRPPCRRAVRAHPEPRRERPAFGYGHPGGPLAARTGASRRPGRNWQGMRPGRLKTSGQRISNRSTGRVT